MKKPQHEVLGFIVYLAPVMASFGQVLRVDPQGCGKCRKCRSIFTAGSLHKASLYKRKNLTLRPTGMWEVQK
jgi:hypothetical protein